jgi:ribosomal-protein-alanine N-acetyltransferase
MPVTLRPWRNTDILALVSLADNPKVSAYLTDGFPKPYNCEAAERFIAMALSENPRKILAISVEGKIAGSIGVYPQHDIYRKNAELAYWLGEPFWGNGYMPLAIQKMCRYAFETWQLERVFARPMASNLRSRKVLEKSGFVLEYEIKGNLIKNEKLEDECCYGLRRNWLEMP